MAQKTATLIKEQTSGVGANQKVYKLSAPVGYDWDWDTDKTTKETNHIVVSANRVMFSGPETYIFPSDADGKILDFGELDGSYRGGLDHGEALRRAGYKIV